MTGRFTRSFLPVAALALASASLSAQAAPVTAAPVVAPAPVAAPAPAAAAVPADVYILTSPGPGPQRWNVVDGLRKQTVASYLEKEALAPEPANNVKPKAVPRAGTKRTRAILEDAVFAPLNHRKVTAKYRYNK